MDYLEFSLAVREDAVEATAELLRRYAPAGVSIEPPYEAIDEDGGVALHHDAPVRLLAWLPAGDAAHDAAGAIRRELRARDGVVRRLRTRTVRDGAWAEAWKRHFPVLRVGLIVIRPSWREYRPRIGEVVINLDPGMAFGTGQHETTRMCLLALEERVQHGMRVLDVGCGSGILSIAAACLGAERVDALDIDPAAVAATKENTARNAVDGVVQVAEGSLGEAWPFAAPAVGRYDLVLANLSSRLVQELAALLVDALAPGGVALVSGLIAEHEPACRAPLERAGARVTESRSDGEWRLLVVEPAL
jgi:ribosomal protein L11 methyltransferase